MYLAGETNSKICDVVGVSDPKTISRWSIKLGWQAEKVKITAEAAAKTKEAIFSEKEQFLKEFMVGTKLAMRAALLHLRSRPAYDDKGIPIYEDNGRQRMDPPDALTSMRMTLVLEHLLNMTAPLHGIDLEAQNLGGGDFAFEYDTLVEQLGKSNPAALDAARTFVGMKPSNGNGNGTS